MAKARDAFRTISEVSEWLDTPAHVLRFWESKFTQVKPVKRAGGRRYYRPDDMALLAGIKALLHDQGMTIKGAQKLLREQGVKHVAGLAPPLDGTDPKPQKAPEIKAVDDVIDVTPTAVVVESNDEPAETAMPMAPAMPPPMRPAFMDAPDEPAAVQDAPAVVELVADVTPELPAEPPMMPDDAQPAEPRLLGHLQHADTDHLRRNAAAIAPLMARLETVRDRMRAT